MLSWSVLNILKNILYFFKHNNSFKSVITLKIMDRFQKIEVALVVLILAFNIFFFVYLVDNGSISGFFIFPDKKVFSPGDFIKEENIYADNEKVIIYLEKPILSRYNNSGSMLPTLNEFSNGVSFKPNSLDEVNVGDVVSFEQDGISIIHRVVEKNVDEKGVYFITRGDNNNVDDEKIRYEDIDSVIVAIIY